MPYLFFYSFTNLAFYFAEVKLITKTVIESEKLKFSVEVILVNKLIGKVQLLILSNGIYFNQCKCQEYKYIEKCICSEFKKYKYKNFFDI